METASPTLGADVVYAPADCSLVAEELWEVFFAHLADSAAADPHRAETDTYLTGPRRTRLLAANMLAASHGASLDTDVWYRLSLIDHDEDALVTTPDLTFVFQLEAVSEAGLNQQKRARLTIKDQAYDSVLEHEGANQVRCQWRIPAAAVVNRRKRIVYRPFRIELLSDRND